MNEREALAIHKALWADPAPQTIQFRDAIYPTRIQKNNRQDFRSVNIGDTVVITQNLKKRSKWTDWVKNHPKGKITWVIKNDNYVGRVESWFEDGAEHHKVIKLDPDDVLLHAVNDAA